VVLSISLDLACLQFLIERMAWEEQYLLTMQGIKNPTCISMCHVPNLVLKYSNNFSVGWLHHHGALMECQNRFEH